MLLSRLWYPMHWHNYQHVQLAAPPTEKWEDEILILIWDISCFHDQSCLVADVEYFGFHSGISLWSFGCVFKLNSFLPFCSIDFQHEILVLSSIITSDLEDLPIGGSLPVMKLHAKQINEPYLCLLPTNEGCSGGMIHSNIHTISCWKMNCFPNESLQFHPINTQ